MLNNIEEGGDDTYELTFTMVYLSSQELLWEEKKKLFDFDNFAKKLEIMAHIFSFRFAILKQ